MTGENREIRTFALKQTSLMLMIDDTVNLYNITGPHSYDAFHNCESFYHLFLYSL